MNTTTDGILEKALSGSRLNLQEGRSLCAETDLNKLGQAAHALRLQKTDPRIATYIVDRHINYTNVCVVACDFCSFYRRPDEEEGYILSREELDEKIFQTKAAGGRQVLLQGGLHPKLSLDFYVDLLRYLKAKHRIHLHAFSPPEIKHFATLYRKSFREILSLLQDAGLDSMPGGGAEILVDRVRRLLSPGKCTGGEWLQIMEDAHAIGMKTTATMMFGHVETSEERIVHLMRLRELQDRTGGFVAFIPWTYQCGMDAHELEPSRRRKSRKDGVDRLAGIPRVSAFEYLRMLAISRLMLDNFANIQSSWLTEGEKIGQVGLRFGANDIGSVMLEERVLYAAGVTNTTTTLRIRELIADAGFIPRQRDMYYHVMAESSSLAKAAAVA